MAKSLLSTDLPNLSIQCNAIETRNSVIGRCTPPNSLAPSVCFSSVTVGYLGCLVLVFSYWPWSMCEKRQPDGVSGFRVAHVALCPDDPGSDILFFFFHFGLSG